MTQDSFKEMYEANRTDFKPAEGELPNTLARFNLESVKTAIKKYGEGDTMNVGNVVMVVAMMLLCTALYNTKKKKTADEEKLSKQAAAVNQAVTSLDRADVEQSNRQINQAYAQAAAEREGGAYQPNMSRTERIIKKKTPTIAVFDPDAK